MAPPDTQAEIDAQCEREDAGIERAAVALLWATRPVLTAGPVSEMTPDEYWQGFSERERRVYLYRARACVAAWENYMNVDRHAEAQDG